MGCLPLTRVLVPVDEFGEHELRLLRRWRFEENCSCASLVPDDQFLMGLQVAAIAVDLAKELAMDMKDERHRQSFGTSGSHDLVDGVPVAGELALIPVAKPRRLRTEGELLASAGLYGHPLDS